MTVPDDIYRLVEQFDRDRTELKSPNFNEAELRAQYLNPMIKALGWDIYNESGALRADFEVVHEASVRVGGAHKAPDYGFYVGRKPKFFVEAKKPAVNLSVDTAPAFQLRRYAWSAKMPVSVLTDFEEFAIYDGSVRPVKDDPASRARLHLIPYSQYVDRWDEINGMFSREAVYDGVIDQIAANQDKRSKTTVDRAFLAEIERWRELLARNIALRNPGLTQRELNFAVQMTVDRIIFLRMAEDRGIEQYGRLLALRNGKDVYERLRDLYRQADERYNSGLFHFKEERGRDFPDDLTPRLTIDDKVLKDIFKNLYYPDSAYEFSVLPVDVLGQVYEQFLGKVITTSPKGRVTIEEKPEVRKAGGVYYTPTYIVEYIVEHTIGKLLEGKTPRTARGTTIVDPACGSGSFLLGAYEFLLNWYRDRYVADGPEKHRKQLYETVNADPDGMVTREWRLATDERKRILLEHIYGVDIDQQAVEVTKLSLLLKLLEGETDQTLNRQLQFFHERVLPDLDSNIKCGNSLIEPDFYTNQQIGMFDLEEMQRVNVFDWKVGFPEIMTRGGFDAIIGNPPYIFTREQLTLPERSYYASKYHASWEKQNTFMLFMELLLSLLNRQGIASYIVPNSWLTIESAKLLRHAYVPNILLVADLNYQVFDRVSLEPSVFVVSASAVTDNPLVLRAASKDEFAHASAVPINRSGWLTPGNRIVFSDSPEVDAIIAKVCSASVTIGDVFDVRTGLQAYERGRGTPPQTAEEVKNHVFDRLNWADENSIRYLEGADVARYHLSWSGMWMQYGPWLSQPRDIAMFTRPRILLREITSPPPYCLNGVLTTEQFLNNKSVLNVLHPMDDLGDLSCLLGMVNSKLWSTYYKARAVKSARRIFPKVVIKNLREFPYPSSIEATQRQSMLLLVDRMSALQEQLKTARTSHDKSFLQRQIKATDREIDRLVYELYGLTDEEIAIVEAATA